MSINSVCKISRMHIVNFEWPATKKVTIAAYIKPIWLYWTIKWLYNTPNNYFGLISFKKLNTDSKKVLNSIQCLVKFPCLLEQTEIIWFILNVTLQPQVMVKTKLVQEIKLGLCSLISGSFTNSLKLEYNRSANLLKRYFLICRAQVTRWKLSPDFKNREEWKIHMYFGVSFRKLYLRCAVLTLFF